MKISIVFAVELGIFRIVLGKINNWGKVSITVLISNIISTLIGAVIFAIVMIVSYNSEQTLLKLVYGKDAFDTVMFGVHGAILGGIGFLIHNLYYFIISNNLILGCEDSDF